jgi:hypothetical protein
VLAGKLDPRSGNSVVAAVNGLVAALRESEVEARLVDLEQTLRADATEAAA